MKKKRVLVARILGIEQCLEKYSLQKLIDLEKDLRVELEKKFLTMRNLFGK